MDREVVLQDCRLLRGQESRVKAERERAMRDSGWWFPYLVGAQGDG
jgi:hypothetical protein